MTELIASCDINLEIAYNNRKTSCELNVPYELTTFQDILTEILKQFQLELIDDIIFKVNEKIIDNKNFQQLIKQFIQPKQLIRFLYGPENTVYETKKIQKILQPLRPPNFDENSLVPQGGGDSLIILNQNHVFINVDEILIYYKFSLQQKIGEIRDLIYSSVIQNFGHFIDLYYEQSLIKTKDYNKTIGEMFIKLIKLDQQDRPILNLQYKVRTLGG